MAMSKFDQDYLSGGHGGVPVNWSGVAPTHHVIKLEPGVNKVDLLYCRSVADITSMVVTGGEDTKEEFHVTKTRFRGPGSTIFTTTRRNFMECRTLFVAYRDGYTNLTITSPCQCLLVIN